MLSKSFNYRAEQGFTLLEMLLVVGIMAIVAGALVVSLQSGVRTDNQVQVAKSEMEQIRRALLNYKRDNGSFPDRDTVSPVDFTFLFDTTNTWDPNYRTGKRGPYLSGGDTGLVDVGKALKKAGDGLLHDDSEGVYELVRGMPDPFALPPVDNNESRPNFTYPCAEDNSTGVNDDCLLDWRYVGQGNSDEPHESYGRPYFLFDLDNSDARIISMGPNGVYENTAALTCPPNPAGDDLVLCLY